MDEYLTFNKIARNMLIKLTLNFLIYIYCAVYTNIFEINSIRFDCWKAKLEIRKLSFWDISILWW